MKNSLIKIIFIFLFAFILFFCQKANCQTDNSKGTNHSQIYDELLKKNIPVPESVIVPEQTPQINEQEKQIPKETQNTETKDELEQLLPKLENELYKGWSILSTPILWQPESNIPTIVSASQDLLNELGVEKILKQSYTKENHNVEVIVYKFKDFAQAFSAYTILHGGNSSKLKIGRNTSESERLINFWKGSYFIDLHINNNEDTLAKEFIVLFSQDIGKNILAEQLPPVVAIQLPALYRLQDSEKYCTGPLCCNEFILKGNPDITCSLLGLQNSGGTISAQYNLSETKDNKKPETDEGKISLILTRYTSTENAYSVFNTLKQHFEEKQKSNKEIDLDFDPNDSTVKIKYNKNNYTMLKQKGNLLAIVYNLTNKKSGEQILGLIPWPIQINKPINTISPDKAKEQEIKPENN